MTFVTNMMCFSPEDALTKMFCNLHIIESNPELDASSVESVQKLLHHLCLGGGQQTTGAQGGAGSLGMKFIVNIEPTPASSGQRLHIGKIVIDS